MASPIPPPPSKEAQENAFGAFANPNPRTRVGEDPQEPKYDKVRDVHGRLVSNKRANQPYLSYGKWKMKQEELEREKAERAKRRAEKTAKGEKLEKEDLDEPEESAIVALLKVFLVCLLFVSLTGKFVTGSFTFGYKGKWVQLKTYWPPTEKTFTEAELAHYDGTTLKLPIYIAIDGDVYDVSASPRIYGPGGSYSHFAGIDAARAFTTGCFVIHRTHDLRGLSQPELDAVEHWKDFFRNSEKYSYVGKVIHPPIDPNSPLPPRCDAQGNAIPDDIPPLNKKVPAKEAHGGEL